MGYHIRLLCSCGVSVHDTSLGRNAREGGLGHGQHTAADSFKLSGLEGCQAVCFGLSSAACVGYAPSSELREIHR